jgi:hypothetical protein
MIKNIFIKVIASFIIFACAMFYYFGFKPRIDFNNFRQPLVREAQGLLKIKIIDLATHQIIQEGNLEITQIKKKREDWLPLSFVPEYNGEYIFDSYYIDVGGKFGVGHSRVCYDNKESMSGFGMWLGKFDESTFSWEWYERTQDNVYKKFQGNGAVNVEYEKIDDENCWVISKISFEGDHIFRAHKSGHSNKAELKGEEREDWQGTIYDGSWIEW